MERAEYEKAMFDLCKPVAIEEMEKQGREERDLFPNGDFTEYAQNYGYFTVFIPNYIDWSDRMVFQINYDSGKRNMKIVDSHYFKA